MKNILTLSLLLALTTACDNSANQAHDYQAHDHGGMHAHTEELGEVHEHGHDETRAIGSLTHESITLEVEVPIEITADTSGHYHIQCEGGSASVQLWIGDQDDGNIRSRITNYDLAADAIAHIDIEAPADFTYEDQLWIQIGDWKGSLPLSE